MKVVVTWGDTLWDGKDFVNVKPEEAKLETVVLKPDCERDKLALKLLRDGVLALFYQDQLILYPRKTMDKA